MKSNRGEIVLVLFPNSNLRTTKRRPALVIQRDNLQTGLAQTIVAMITSNMARAGHASRVTVSLSTSDGRLTGLKSDSVIVTDNLATVHDDEIDRSLGVWPAMQQVDEALRHTLGL
jgi:mRNA interferase MazF